MVGDTVKRKTPRQASGVFGKRIPLGQGFVPSDGASDLSLEVPPLARGGTKWEGFFIFIFW